MAIFIPLEKFWSLKQQKIFRRQFLFDLGYYFLNSLLPKLMLILPMSLVAVIIHRLEPMGLYIWVGSIPFLLRFILAIIVGEFGAYWGHRWCHEIPVLWRFHRIHHSAEEIDWLVNTRAHPFDIFLTRFCGLLPVYLLGLAQPTSNSVDLIPLLYAVVGTVWSFFIHANVRWRFGWIEKWISTPAFHHWHHTNDDPKHIDKNYAAILPCFDQLFGTFYLPKNRWPSKYGIDTQIPASFTEQLLEPLRITKTLT